MEELKKIFDFYQNLMKEAEAKHKTSIDNILNLDNPVFGDWTKEEVRLFEYALERATICQKAIRIIEEEKIAEKFK